MRFSLLYSNMWLGKTNSMHTWRDRSMKKRIGLLFTAIMLIAVLVGCGSTVDHKVDEKSAATQKSEASVAEKGWPRTFTDVEGNEIVMDKKPEKLISLWYSYPEFLVPLEETPIGSTDGKFLASLAYLKDIEAMKAVADLGDKLAPNVEKIIELEPDIIFATTNHQEIYDALKKIAPVAVLDREAFLADWRLGVRTFGEILGKEEKAESIIKDITGKISAGREKLKNMDGETIALIKTWDGKSYYIEGPKDSSYLYTFDTEKGLGLTPDPSFVKMAGEKVSLEGLSTIQADHIFLEADISLNKSILEGLNNNSVWNSLKAVKNKNVYFLDISAVTGGPLATEYGVQTIVEALSK